MVRRDGIMRRAEVWRDVRADAGDVRREMRVEVTDGSAEMLGRDVRHRRARGRGVPPPAGWPGAGFAASAVPVTQKSDREPEIRAVMAFRFVMSLTNLRI